ncbi:MAG TPA: hypothetical protein VMC79_12530, partial [Rectinemataceae bacterium]|nr:hypothetical protein [Rectinemataceae bacterium]
GLAEEITVSYLVETAERRAGSLVAGLGGIWTPSKEQSMWTALGLRWSVPGSSFATGGLSNPGTVTFTAGEKKAAGDFQHGAALAATYTQEEASGRYRMEGMEADSGYITGFRPAVGWTGTLEQIVDTSMSTSFPTITNQLHADGSTQLALHVANPSTDIDISKVETLPPYQNFKTLTFYVNKADSGLDGASLTLSIDDGSSSDTFISATVPFVDLSMGWNKILVHYGTSDLRVYHQSSENGPIQASSGPSATLDQSYSSGSRIHITSSGLVAADSFWVDEVILEDSVGVAAANFQGSLSYTDASFKLGSGKMPILSGITLKADSSAAYSNDSFISGGGSVNTILGPLGLGLHARGAASQSSNPAFSGGHELILPAAASPVKVDDKFDFDPSTGAFGREDTVTLGVARISALNLFQRSSWVPGSDSLSGSLAQDWKGSIGFANGRIVSSLDASNRASPPAVSVGTGYGNAWLSGFSYVLPSYEGDSELRSEKLGLKLRLSPDAEFLSGSIGTSAQPQSLTAAGTGLHEDSATLRLTAPLSFNRLKVAPYYQRSWSDQRDGSAGDMGGDASLALGDFSGLPLLYRNAPISELWDASASTSFASQTTVNGVPLSSAAYTPEAGVILSRDFGSNWYDLIEPSALSFAFRRLLVRSDASISDAAVWDATAKFAAVNLFGSEGAYPLGLPFDSDEYYVTIQTTISKYVGESTDRIGIQTQHLATLYAGASDSLSAENRFSLSTQPAQSQWSEYVQLDLTRTIRRSWLLSIYRLLVPERAAAVSRDADASGETGTMSTSPDQAEPETAPAGAKGISIASLYLQDIATRIPTLRASLEVTASLSNTITDAAAPPLSWAFGESYVSKLTVPERLTLSAKGGLSQQFDGSTGLLIFDITLGIEAIISF